MPEYFIYPLYTGIIGITALAVIPRETIRRLSTYGIMFSLIDVIDILVFTKLFMVGGYKNYGPFGYFGFPFFTPLALTIYFILYLYFLPKRLVLSYLYAMMAACYSLLMSYVLENLGIFIWYKERLIIPFFIFLFWHVLVTWIYRKYEL